MEQPVAAAFRQGVERALTTIGREGPLPPVPGALVVEAASGGIVLRTAVDENHLIRAARHEGAQDAAHRAVLDVLCRECEGCPVQDAADHGAIRAMHALRTPSVARPASGIALPRNSGAAFALAEALVRALRRRYATLRTLPSGPNEFAAPPGVPWRRLDHEARMMRISEAMAGFVAERALARGSIAVVKLERDLTGEEVRVDIAFSQDIPAREKPSLTRAVERRLKERVEDKLQVYMEPVKDRNAVRRL